MIVLIKSSVVKPEKLWITHIWQHALSLKEYFLLFGFYKADYSWVSDFFLMGDVTYTCGMYPLNPVN